MPSTPEPIAIVASACILPGCPDKKSLWDCIANDDQRYGHAPYNHWRVDPEHALQTTQTAYKSDYAWSDIGGYIKDDPSLNQSSLIGLDPLQRWSIYCAEQCLREADITTKQLQRCDTIMGNLAYPSHSYAEFAEQVIMRQALNLDEPQSGAEARWNAAAPARSIKQHCQLNGQTINLDAACASGLYAMKIACDRLRDYRCDLALAGAVNAVDSYLLHVGFCALGAKSRIGLSRPFHQDADGLIPAEGAAVLALQRLSDAQQQEKKVLGVIHDIGLSNDGRSGGFLAPDSNGQYRAMQNAYRHLTIDPTDIDYIECHATGTRGGDHVEIESLDHYYQQSDLHLSSLKANLGHLITVAGIAGVMKTLACMEQETIPSCRHAFPLLTEIPARFQIHETAQSWELRNTNRFAAISAFGFGGNNAHAVLSQYPIETQKRSRSVKKNSRARKIAILNMNVINGDGEHPLHVSKYAQSRKSNDQGTIDLNLSQTPFPPSDLKRSLGQQLLLTRSAQECMRAFPDISEQLGIYIGMDTDPDACRFCTRARVPSLLKEHGLAAQDIDAIKNTFAPPINAADVIGCMPNIPANRLHNIFNALGPGFSIADDERSGTQAFILAAEAILRQEIHYAIVGAVDIARNSIHKHALKQSGIAHEHLNNIAASCLICDAERIPDTHEALAIIDLDNIELDQNPDKERAYQPYAHAADGLLQLLLGIQVRGLHGSAHNHNFLLSQQQSSKQAGISTTSFQHGIQAMPRVYCFSGNNISALRQHIQSATLSDNADAMRLAIVAFPSEFSQQQQLAIKHLDKNGHHNPWQERHIIFEPKSLPGDIASVYTGAASAYQHMLEDLILAKPQIITDTQDRIHNPVTIAQWLYKQDKHSSTAFEELSASSFACQLHATLLEKFGIQVDATFGLSSGETNSMFAHGLWSDSMDSMFDDIAHSGLYQTQLAGTFSAVKKHLGIDQDQTIHWENWRIIAPVSNIEKIVDTQSDVWISIINNDDDCVICGTQAACKSVLIHLDPSCMQPLGHDMAVHCPVASPFAETWRKLHTRPTNTTYGIRFYSNYLGGLYTPTEERIADALTGQALQCIDFRPIVNAVFNDGVRIFIEHGPRDSLSQSIDKILVGKDHRCLAFDRAHQDARYSVCSVAAHLWCLGKTVQFDYLQDEQHAAEKYMRFNLSLPQPELDAKQLTPYLTLPSAPTTNIKSVPVSVPATKAPVHNVQQTASRSQTPIQTPVNQDPQHEQLRQLHAAHQQYLKKQQVAFQAYLDITKDIAAALQGHVDIPTNPRPLATAPTVVLNESQSTKYPGPQFSRSDLEHLSSGNISERFGTAFEEQDQYDIQVRMPEPPLLLCDRVLGIDAVPKSMGKGCIWTETDIRADAIYMHNGHMAPGYFIEAGQADLLLISYLGIDFLNKGERAYRLLGCELTFHGSLPKPGETLHYDIHVDGHAVQGDVRLFFFHYDCKVNGQTRLSVRNGQAGFFTKQELQDGGGLIWDPATAPYTEAVSPSPTALCTKQLFSKADLQALKQNDVLACFGNAFWPTQLHTRTPNLGQQHSWFIDEIEVFDPNGGPKGRGYLKAIAHNYPDAWYFKGHFKNDPCMPGTLMAEACIQAMSFYLCAYGATLRKDGWRFEPQSDLTYTFLCRGQVLPSSSLLSYEIFVDELILDPHPSLKAHVVASVDGKQAFLCEGLCLQLVQDFPLSSNDTIIKNDSHDQRSLAYIGNLPLNHASLMHCAIGDPHRAFGPAFKYHPGKRTPRLPGEPYHFMTRILQVDGPFGTKAPLHHVSAVYDIPSDAWYFNDHASKVMPWAVLMEIALQPCGWLASYSGCTFSSPDELLFRNLDGTATPYRDITKYDKSIRSEVTLHTRSQVGETIIVSFKIQSYCDDELILEMSTSFGFFTPASMQDQKGLAISDTEHARYHREPVTIADEKILSDVSRNKLRMINRIDGFDQEQHWIRSQMDIAGNEWFFKAHFYQDPVQPGSLGIEAMLQTLHAWMLLKQYDKRFDNPQIEAVCSKQESEWHYRGQVIPENERVTVDADIQEEVVGHDIVVHACVRLWVDGLKIYEAPRIALRMYDGNSNTHTQENKWQLRLSEHSYLLDHCPNYMTPCLPMMGFVDLIYTQYPDTPCLKRLQLKQWLTFDDNDRNGTIQRHDNELHVLDETEHLLAIAEIDNSKKHCTSCPI